MTCSKCSAALLNQFQFDRGLCSMCLTGSSLSALVGLAAYVAAGGPQVERSETSWRSDIEWKRSVFPEVM